MKRVPSITFIRANLSPYDHVVCVILSTIKRDTKSVRYIVSFLYELQVNTKTEPDGQRRGTESKKKKLNILLLSLEIPEKKLRLKDVWTHFCLLCIDLVSFGLTVT